MAIQTNLDAAISDLKADLETMNFLSDMGKAAVDQEIIDAIQGDIDSLASSYNAEFWSEWAGHPTTPGLHQVTAEELAHWLFDDQAADYHRLIIILRPTNSDEEMRYTTDVPLPS